MRARNWPIRRISLRRWPRRTLRRTWNSSPLLRNCEQGAGGLTRGTRPKCASASSVSCVCWPPFIDQTFVRGWRKLPRGSITFADLMFVGYMIWFEWRRSGEMRRRGSTRRPLVRGGRWTSQGRSWARCATGGGVHPRTTLLAWLPDAGCGDQSTEGACRLEYVPGFTSLS